MPKKTAIKKSAFVGYTEEEIASIEATTYIVQMGCDVFEVDGKFVFSKKGAIIYRNKILRDLLSEIQGGNAKQKSNAKFILHHLRILPLRIH